MPTLGEQIVADAMGLLGDRYVYGADGPYQFDCSGLAQFLYRGRGIKIPRVSSEQYAAGTPITADQLQPGDLVFSEWEGDDVPHHGHVAIYAGNGQIIEAPHPGGVVQLVPLNAYYRDHVDGYVRPRGLDDTGATTLAQGESFLGIPSIPDPVPGLNNLLTIPSQIADFFGEAYTTLVGTVKFFSAFFQVSTYIRIGAGLFGILFLGFGITFLAREARP